MPAGRPSTYSEDMAAEICQGLAEGKSLRTVCKPDHMPALSTIFLWLRNHNEFSEQYAIAKEECADLWAEDIVDIADNQVGQPLYIDGELYLRDGKPVFVVDGPAVNHARLRVDSRKWTAAKLKPKKYGDRMEHDVGEGLERLILRDLTGSDD